MHLFSKSVKRLLIQGLVLAAVPSALAQQADSIVSKQTIIKSNSQSKGLKIKGVVKEAATGKAVPAISVSVEGYSAALTDDKGAFQISVPDYKAVLILSGSGYQTKRLALKGRGTVEVLLYEEAFNSLYDEAVLPFGSKPQNRTSYSVQTLNTKGAWNRALETPDSYLQGMLSGLNVQRRSGTPGIGADMILRGYSSLYASNTPLIVVDGMIYDAGVHGSSLIAGHRTNRLANIDLKDIDNITILKDGSSVYGTRGANGVILITTGRAKGEATRFDFAAYSGFNNTVRELPVLGAENFRIYLADLLQTKPETTDGSIQSMPFMNMTNDNSSAYWTYHQNTNWQNKVMDNGYNQNYYLKVSGGDNIATYALSMGYQSNDGIISTTGVKRYEMRFNANLNLTSKLKAQANLAFTRSDQVLRDQGTAYNTSPLYLAQVKAPFLTSHDVSQGNVQSPNTADADIFSISNPYVAARNVMGNNNNYRFVGSTNFVYTFNRALSLNVLAGLTFDKVRERAYTPEEGFAPVVLSNAIGYNRPSAGVERFNSLYTDSWLSVKHNFSKLSNLVANLGFRFNDSKSESDFGLTYNTASDDFVTLGAGQSSLRVVGGDLGHWNWLNSYLNLDYSAANKYFLSFNVAADASSRFGKDAKDGFAFNGNKFAFLPSAAVAWLISSEPFMAGNKFIETLKLRASYGLSGNDNIGNYAAKTYYISQNFLGREGLIRGNIGNSSLQWETVSKANTGLDAAFLNERLNVSFDLYHHKTTNMLVYQNLYAYNGFNSAVSNSGAMKNVGAELSVNGRIINKGNFKWDLGVNVSRNRNKVTALPQDEIISNYGGATMITKVGSSANLFYGYKSNGVYLSAAEASASQLTNKLADGSVVAVEAGDMKFVDINGDRIIDEKDREVIGNPNPDFAGGLSNSLTYKRWSVRALFTFSVGNDIYNGVRAQLESLSGFENQTQAVLNRWRTEGQVTNIPRAAWGDPAGNSRFSDRWIEDGSYFRLRTLSVDYDIPVKRILKSATVYAIANNAFTLTKYLGYDPEFSASGSPFARGVDVGLEPQFSSVQLGVRLGL